jgi:hypothetical protein
MLQRSGDGAAWSVAIGHGVRGRSSGGAVWHVATAY